MSAGKPIRLALLDPAATKLEGPFERFIADTLYMRDYGMGPRAIEADSVGTLWVSGHSGAKFGLLLGTVAFLGAIVATADLNLMGSSTQERNDGAVILGSAALGVLVGYLVGSQIDAWDQEYPKEKKTGPGRQ